jgi:hypothetical protein
VTWQHPDYKHTGYQPPPADIEAAAFVCHDVREESEAYTATEAIEMRIALERLIGAAREAISFLDMSLLKLLDGQPEIIRDGRKFYVAAKTVRERVDHDAVIDHVRHICRDAAGEVDDAAERYDEGSRDLIAVGAGLGAKVMRDLYLSDSTSVKKQQLDRYGIPRNVIDVQRGAKMVKEIPATGEPDS